MSGYDGQGQGTTGDTSSMPHTDSWGDRISENRKAELRSYLTFWEDATQRGSRRGPFDGVRLTGADVFWLAALTEAGSDDSIERVSKWLAKSFVPNLLRSRLGELHLEGAALDGAQLRDANLALTCLEGASLKDACLDEINLTAARLRGATLTGASLDDAILVKAHLEGVDLSLARLRHANLRETRLDGSNLQMAHLEGVILTDAHLEQANLSFAHLPMADLTGVFIDVETDLRGASLGGQTEFAQVADVHWGGVNLALLGGRLHPPIGDERIAQAWKLEPIAVIEGEPKPSRQEREERRREHLDEGMRLWRAAVRANRQFALALQAHGMYEEAAAFYYHADSCQRQVLGRSGWRMLGPWLFSWFLWGLAGYGYRPGRVVGWYLAVITSFALAYWGASNGVGSFIPILEPLQMQHLQWYEALILSVSSFHGRGFFQPLNSLGNPVAILAAVESIAGLLIEASIIATFTQRFFGSR